MKYNQNEKLKQMDLSTMLVGVDVGSEIHYARAFDYRGVELSGIFKVSNDAAGFEAFEKWKQELMNKHDKSKVIVGMEPTWKIEQEKIKQLEKIKENCLYRIKNYDEYTLFYGCNKNNKGIGKFAEDCKPTLECEKYCK